MALTTDASLRKSVIYELYVRSHTAEGTFQAVIPDLDRIRALERLLEAGGDGEEAGAFFAAAAGDGECL